MSGGLEQVLSEIEEAGIAAEALKQSVTTAMCVMLWTDFAEWRAWADGRGWTTGPRTAETFRAQGRVLAQVAAELQR